MLYSLFCFSLSIFKLLTSFKKILFWVICSLYNFSILLFFSDIFSKLFSKISIWFSAFDNFWDKSLFEYSKIWILILKSFMLFFSSSKIFSSSIFCIASFNRSFILVNSVSESNSSPFINLNNLNLSEYLFWIYSS